MKNNLFLVAPTCLAILAIAGMQDASARTETTLS